MKALGPARDKTLWDTLVNDKFGGKSPVLSPEASITAAKRLYRKALGRPWKGPVKLTSGNRSTWVRRGVLVVNPNERHNSGGLREIIHSISHYAHNRLHPDDAPHSRRQAKLEGKLVTYAIKSGWLEPGALEPKGKRKVAVKAKLKQKADPYYLSLKKLERKHGFTGKIENDCGLRDYVVKPCSLFPEGLITMHHDWAETLDRVEHCVFNPELIENGYYGR